jgi:hypothetical protein
VNRGGQLLDYVNMGPLNQMLTDLAVGDKTDRSVSIRCRLVSASEAADFSLVLAWV